jgi:hypothetical protein
MAEKGFTYIGSPEIHESVNGGASEFQITLMGGGHHPKCFHYEWGPCTCAYYENEATDLPIPSSRLGWLRRQFNKTTAGF